MEGNLFLFGMVVSALDMFDFVPKKEHPYLNKHFEEMCYDISPKLVKIKYEETTEVSASKGSDKATLSEKTFIPGANKEQEYEYLDIKNYVNDVNRENSEVLAVQDQNGVEKEGYTYGLNRISAKIGKEDVIYNYSGRGDVSSIHAGDKKYSYSYDSYGNLLNEDGNAIGALHDKKKAGAFKNSFTYNGEQTDYSTNLQYLRNRYLDTETGTFLTEDTYRGSLTELKSHNRYSYAENNPVNKIDPSGHKVKKVSSKKVSKAVSAISSVAKKVVTNVSSANGASGHKTTRSKSSNTTHKAKTSSAKSSGHKAKKSSGGGLVNTLFGWGEKAWNHAKKGVAKAYKKVCTTAKRVKKGFDDAKKTVGKALNTVKEKTVSAVKKFGKAVSDFKKKHPILTGAIIIGAAAVLTVATGGAGAGLLGAACAGALSGSIIGAGAGATINFASTLMHGGSLKDALGSAAQGFGSGAASGAISGFLTGGAAGLSAVKNPSALVKVAEKVAGSKPGQWAINTVADTAGNLGDRALSGEKITAGDVAFSLVTNAAFNGAPIAFNKVKGTKGGQMVGGKLSDLGNAAKGKLGNATSAVKEKVGARFANAGGKTVNTTSVSGGGGRKTDFYVGKQGVATSLKEYDDFVAAGSSKAVNSNNASASVSKRKPSLKLDLQFFAKKGESAFGNYKFKEGVDIDLRGKGTYKDALDIAFEKTGIPKEDYTITKWGKDKYGKSFPVEFRAKNGYEVNIDIGHSPNGEAPTIPHIGWQTAGKRGNGGGTRGHIFVNDVPYNR